MNIYFKRFTLILAALALLGTTQGCAVSEKTCLQNDWQTLGYKHGEQGQSLDSLDRYVNDCAEGIVLYCTAENGTKQGSNVSSYSGACPAEIEKPFLTNYLEGLRIAQEDLQIEYDRDTIELDALRANRDRLAIAGEPHLRDDKRIKFITGRIQSNTSKRLSINENIRKWAGRV